MVSWRRSKDDEQPPPPGADAPAAVEVWRDDAGALLSGSPDVVAALVSQLTSVGGVEAVSSPVTPADALAVFATGYVDGATSSQYIRFTDESLALLEQHGAVPNGRGGFHTFVRSDVGIAGNLEWVPTSAGPERALAFQTAAVGLALRTAVKNVEAAVARVEDKIDQVAALLRAERLGNVLGDQRTLDALVLNIDQGDPLTATDWSSIAALGPAITRDLEKLRAHLRTQVEEVDGSWRPRQRVNEADQLMADGLLTETLGLLLLAEHNFSQWQHLRLRRIADAEPENLDAAVRQAKAAMDDHLQADLTFLRQFESVQADILEPRDHDGFAVIQNRALGRADSQLSDLTRWFAEQRLLDLEAVDRRARPGLRDSVTSVIGAGRDRLPPLRRSDRQTERPPAPAVEEARSLDWAVAGPPIGVWSTFEGTFSNVMGAELTLDADGTGSVRHYSAMFGDDDRRLLWEHRGHGRLAILLDADEPAEPADWDEFEYEAKRVQSDAGAADILVNVDHDDDGSTRGGWFPVGGFWTLEGPIQLVERPS